MHRQLRSLPSTEGLSIARPARTLDEVAIDSDPRRLLEQLRAASLGRDVHLVGGPHTTAPPTGAVELVYTVAGQRRS